MPVKRKNNTICIELGPHKYVYDERSPILGEGAMGVVYKGYELGTGKTVAIKRVRDCFANIPDIRKRAHLEANLMFSHPNLVEMLGCFEVDLQRGPIFIVSGFIDGENIDHFINRELKAFPNVEHRICYMFLSVLDALSYIHKKGIIHMDIKPSNIMVEKGRNIRLMDLGIADVSNHAVAEGMMGTPKYAAPEQFATKDKHIIKLGPSTDIYEAGVTLYELITKKNPFVTSSIEDSKKRHETLVLQKTPDISNEVLNIIRKATAIDPSMRYQSAAEMKFALKQVLINPISKPKIWLYVSVAMISILILFAVVLLYILNVNI